MPGDVNQQQELSLFLFITVILFPLLSVVLMGSIGLVVWINQLLSHVG